MSTLEKTPIQKQLVLASAFLVINAFIWYFLAAQTLEEITNKLAPSYFDLTIIWSIHFATLAFSFIGGTLLVKRIGRQTLFLFWTVLGIISPLTLFALNFARMPIALLTALLFGLSTGLGMPNCMEFFTKSTVTGNRGRYGGAIMLASGLGLFLLSMVGEAIEVRVSILIVWRLIGLLVLLMSKPFKESKLQTTSISYRFIVNQRSFLLYLIPWIMFSLVNYLSIPVQFNILEESMVRSLAIIGNAIMGLSAVAAGFLMDYFGRKHAAIAGFVLLGLSYAILGLYPNEIASWYFYTVLDGMTWGILIVFFVITLWGDLSSNAPSDKYYAIGVLPFFISKFLQLTLGSDIATTIPSNAIFSFTAFFLFLAVLPLVYAPETLPEKTMKDRELKGYIEKAQKVKEKHS